MEIRVLVAYASKHGSTTEIAEKIGMVLRAHGLSCEVLPAELVDSLSTFGAVVLGSAVYVGQWQGDAARFLETHEAALRERPVWLFSCGPTGEGDPVELMKGWRFPEKLQPLADRIQPRDIAFFHGMLDSSKLSLAERLLVKGINAPLGDFRDWESITAWAAAIAGALRPT